MEKLRLPCYRFCCICERQGESKSFVWCTLLYVLLCGAVVLIRRDDVFFSQTMVFSCSGLPLRPVTEGKIPYAPLLLFLSAIYRSYSLEMGSWMVRVGIVFSFTSVGFLVSFSEDWALPGVLFFSSYVCFFAPTTTLYIILPALLLFLEIRDIIQSKWS